MGTPLNISSNIAVTCLSSQCGVSAPIPNLRIHFAGGAGNLWKPTARGGCSEPCPRLIAPYLLQVLLVVPALSAPSAHGGTAPARVGPR